MGQHSSPLRVILQTAQHLLFLWLLAHVRGSLFSLASNSRATELLYTLQEGLPKGVHIGSIGDDLQLDVFADPPLSFSLASKGLSEKYVNLNNSTGELCTSSEELDREALCPHSLVAQECVLLLDIIILPQEYFRLIKVKIAIIDINDNAPHFPVPQIYISVPENAPVNTRIVIEHPAYDPDGGTNGVQTYRLVDYHGVFTLDVEENESGERTPYLIIMGPLDRETKAEYETTIIAEDGGSPPLVGSATLSILISDVNDNCPQFNASQINATLYGNSTIGTQVVTVHAMDRDLGPNALITYAFSERVPQAVKEYFHLDELKGIIKLSKRIDGSTVQQHKLTILANGPGCIPAVITVFISINKITFRPPELIPRYIANEENGVIYLKELEPVHSPLAFFTIKDPDEKYQVNCYLEGQGPFRLSAFKPYNNEYLLETTDALDYELKQSYNIAVVALSRDGHQVKKLLKVQILDENDNSPVFTESTVEITIEENNEPNAFLAKLYATDADSNESGQVSYFLGPDAPSYFTLDSVTGILSVSTILDREEKEKYRFTVKARDAGFPSRESVATVHITVLDKNDNNPRFISKDFSFFVPENFPGFGEIGVISVTDADSGQNGWIALSIVNGSDIFVIDNGKGLLRAKVSLDREQQSSYTLWVEAVDGSPVTEVYAVDKDTGMNAVIAYSIIGRRGPKPESFRIDPITGNITLEEALMINDCGLYRLLVKVSDHGYPEPLFSTVMVNLFVNDTVTNESYIETLLKKEPDINIEEKEPQIAMEPSQKEMESDSCTPTLVTLSIICLGSVILVTLMGMYICLRKGKNDHRINENAEVQIPLNRKIDFHMLEKRPIEISNI
uniref:Protocadherin 20 n=1 Tax=Xenopus tropicalis TaxID=8364 RepID=A0A803JGS4_XENTR